MYYFFFATCRLATFLRVGALATVANNASEASFLIGTCVLGDRGVSLGLPGSCDKYLLLLYIYVVLNCIIIMIQTIYYKKEPA